jgi:hypothetical protein
VADVHASADVLATEKQSQMKKIQAYQTSDGELFDKEDEAERHETFIQSRKVFEDFLVSKQNPYQSNAQRAIVRNTIINWEIWRVKNVK